jgi:hypothetical protein
LVDFQPKCQAGHDIIHYSYNILFPYVRWQDRPLCSCLDS